MNIIIGVVLVFVMVFGSYALNGGELHVLWQPFEFSIILGAAVGAYIIGNPKPVRKKIFKELSACMKKPKYGKQEFIELLAMQYQVFKLAKTKGMLALEQHIENPEESTIFQQYPSFLRDHHAVQFFCDYLRLVSLGSDKPYELEAIMDEELEIHHNEDHAMSHSLQLMADGTPALGIVAAVLGVIHTMGSITEPPEVLGKLIGAALVGTFFGVFLSYGIIAPLGTILAARYESEAKYIQCIKVGLLAHLHGAQAAIAVEFARKALANDVRPTFAELEEATTSVPALPA